MPLYYTMLEKDVVIIVKINTKINLIVLNFKFVLREVSIDIFEIDSDRK